MYKIKNKTNKEGKILNKIDFVNLNGYTMTSRNKYFTICGEKIYDVKVIDKKLVNNVVTKKVRTKYKKLITELTDLLISEDDDCEGSMNEVLNRIEKFRQEIKFKYRSYLKKRDLELMAKQLKVFQKEATSKLQELINYNLENKIGKTR